jgi:hypothetical protein
MVEWLMNNKLEDLWKAAVVVLFEVLIAYVSVSGAAAENSDITSEDWKI